MKILRRVLLTFGLALLAVHGARAHKAVTSQYTYDDVFPILRDRCGPCHIQDGPAPMSLLIYNSAVPWAESMRSLLTTEAMPPWFVDSLGPPVRNSHEMSARELDIVLTWASGGTPRGVVGKESAPPAFHSQWTSGPPDLAVP